MMFKFILAILLLITTVPAGAATYYVATTGLDSNPGTSGSPFLTIQKGIDVAVAGDTITVADGTYTVTGDTRYIGRVTATHANGTSGSPITLKSTNPLGADLVLPVHVNGNFGIEINRSYWVIEGFDVAGGGVNAGAGSTGISIQSGTGNLIRKNTIHGIAAGICTNTTDGNTGVYISGSATSTTVESSVIHTIGRLRNGESGCSTTISYNDHGVYVEGGTGTTIQRNVFYNDTRGWPIHVYKGGVSTTTNLNILNNTFANQSNPAAGHILLQTNTVTTANIKNNISYDVYIGMLQCNNIATATNVSVDYNLTDNTAMKTANCAAGVVFGANNTVSTSPGFVNAGANDYTLASGSAALNTGTTTCTAYNGAACDKGAYEAITFASCVVEDGDASKVRVTFNNNANPPLKPTASPGTFTSRKAGANNIITASTVTGSNRVDLTLTNAIVNGNAVDISWASGNLTDSASVGGTLNQGYKAVLNNEPCGNNVGAASTHVFTQTVFVWHGLRGTEAAPVISPYATAPENTNIFVSVGGKGSARVRLGVSCTTADCPPTGFFPRYSKNAGAYTNIVPDTFGADNIALCGNGPDPDVPTSGTTTTQQQSGSGTFAPGALVTNANAIPTVDMALSGRTELEYCFSWDTDTAPNDTFDFRLYQQDGTALNAYTVTPRATIRAMGAGSGF